ncbi:MAG: glycosyltransferase family 4 protein [Gaiellaceae bacterium]
MSRLRVAMMPMLPSENAATRAFCERPLPHLVQTGIDVVLLSPSGNRSYRLLLGRRGPLRKVAAAMYWYGIVLPRRVAQLVRVLSVDTVVVQRSLFRQGSPPVFEALVRLMRKRLVVLIDDAAYAVERPLWTRLRLRLAHRVLTGNREIAAYARRAGADVHMVDGPIDVPRYRVKKHEQRPPVVIGWAGHYAELLRPLVPALADVCRDGAAVVHIVADRPFEAPELDGVLRWERWTMARETTLFDDFDIGIMPLPDDAFSRAKEAYKLKEYMAAGLPVVASPVGHNVEVVNHGANGYLADDPAQWLLYLRLLVESPDLRARLGAAGRRVVLQRYTLPMFARELAAHLRLAESRTQLVVADGRGAR